MNATRVLIAEDEAIPLMGLRDMLMHLGYAVVGEAADGESAVQRARELRPDVVVMDIMMPPGMDGIEAARILIQERVAPVVLMTAYEHRDLVDRATTAGVNAFVYKPYRELQIVSAVEIALDRHTQLRAVEKELADTKEALETRRLVERAKGALMDRHHLSEREAYRRMQRLSMDTRKSMREIADAILLVEQTER